VAHLRAGLAGLERSEETVGSRNLDVRGHVGVGTRQGRSLNTSWRELSLKSLALAAIFDFLSASLGVALVTLPFHLSILRWRQTTIKVGNSLVKNRFLLFLFLLELERLGLEHGEFGDGSKHFA